MRRPLEQNVRGFEQMKAPSDNTRCMAQKIAQDGNTVPLSPRVDPEDCPHARSNMYFCPDCGLEFLTELFDCREE